MGKQWKQCQTLFSGLPKSLQMVISSGSGEVPQSCVTPCDPTDYSPQGSSVHGILQARILGWVAIPFSRGSSRPRDRTHVSRIAGRPQMVITAMKLKDAYSLEGKL